MTALSRKSDGLAIPMTISPSMVHRGQGDRRRAHGVTRLQIYSIAYLCAQVICPTGGVHEFLSSPLAKNILLPFFRNAW
jgi:hypothetical protein